MAIDVVTNMDLAELYEALGKPGARHLREMAEHERDENMRVWSDADSAIDDVINLLDKVTPSAKGLKHDAECWQKHAACLAGHLQKVIREGL